MIIRPGRGLGIPPGDLLNEMDRLMRLEDEDDDEDEDDAEADLP